MFLPLTIHHTIEKGLSVHPGHFGPGDGLKEGGLGMGGICKLQKLLQVTQ